MFKKVLIIVNHTIYYIEYFFFFFVQFYAEISFSKREKKFILKFVRKFYPP